MYVTSEWRNADAVEIQTATFGRTNTDNAHFTNQIKEKFSLLQISDFIDTPLRHDGLDVFHYRPGIKFSSNFKVIYMLLSFLKEKFLCYQISMFPHVKATPTPYFFISYNQQ